MRIIGGRYGGRRVQPPKRIPARPTTDIAKEGLFNILNNHLDYEEIKMLDLFGGTGCISYEFASRGCPDITLIELDGRSIKFIQATASTFEFPIRVLKMDVFRFMETTHETFDFIFAGPPYALSNLREIPDIVQTQGLLKPDGWFIMEHNPNHNFDEHAHFFRKRNYGSTIFSFFSHEKQEK